MDEPRPSPLERMLDRYWQDRAAGGPRPPDEYLKMLSEPGGEAAAQGGEASPTPAGPGPERLGPYLIERELGRGGQAVVYLAQDTRLLRKVALKVMSAGWEAGARALERFRREAELASSLDHPGICPVYDAGRVEGVSYIAMRYVEGRSLAGEIAAARDREAGDASTLGSFVMSAGSSEDTESASGTQPDAGGDETGEASGRDTLSATSVEIGSVISLVERCARALHAAHEAGVVHRDVKPGNIMITPEGEPVILDFGLARSDRPELATLTLSGDQLGTPAYMSPEQLSLEPYALDRRTDVWSLGVTLYECLTLQRPFEAPTRATLYRHILSTEPADPRRLNPSLGRDLTAVMQVALAKERDRRYQTALDFAEDLRRVRRHEPVSVRPAGPLLRLERWARRNPAIASSLAALLVVLVTGLGVSLWLNAEKNANLEGYNRLGRAGQLDELLREAREDLWQVTSDKAPALRAWMARARGLAAELPALEGALEELRATAVPAPHRESPQQRQQRERLAELDLLERHLRGGGVGPGDGDASKISPEKDELIDRLRQERARLEDSAAATGWTFADDPAGTLTFRHETLTRLVERLRRFVSEAPDEITIRRAQSWLELAETVRGRTVEGHAGEAWRACQGRCAGRGGVDHLVPLEGLVPLGPDPESGLEEFAHVQTGEVPQRGSDGQLHLDEDSGLVLVLVPGGTAVIGAQSGENPRSVDRAAMPVHRVRLDPFLISKYEMTQGQWSRATQGANPSLHAPNNDAGFDVTLRHPVERVTWFDAARTLRHLGLELPTEVQWEYAARAGSTTLWWMGNLEKDLWERANLADVTFRRAFPRIQIVTLPAPDGHAVHASVGCFPANPFGLHDMVGNVAEWCRDAFGDYERDPARDGDGLRLVLDQTYRVIRGGRFDMIARHGRSAARFNHRKRPDWTPPWVGIRPCRRLDG